MTKFFINRPIVAIVISIIFVIVGIVAMLGLPIAQYPDIVPPEIFINTFYVGRRRPDRRAVRGHPHRAGDERGGQHELHVLAQRQQRRVEDVRQLRRQDGPEHRPGAGPDAQSPGGFEDALRGPRLRCHGQEVHVLAAHGGGALLAQRHLRRHLSGQLRLHQPERPAHARARGSPASRCSAPGSTPCACG